VPTNTTRGAWEDCTHAVPQQAARAQDAQARGEVIGYTIAEAKSAEGLANWVAENFPASEYAANATATSANAQKAAHDAMKAGEDGKADLGTLKQYMATAQQAAKDLQAMTDKLVAESLPTLAPTTQTPPTAPATTPTSETESSGEVVGEETKSAK